ncbi:MAG: Glyoxalase/bleomycin resistance protein/dioxygenase [Bacillota bacterium]|jgi:catechol 2,3-dioxygenase-like lactoylglutathione lyase family enzyme|nr:Glyoxalase/bleomycin resistance protein/dioxygenase [Bacillota bacterium]
MKFRCPLIVVENMGRSRAFYEEVLGQKVVMDFGENITFSGDFSLQTKDSWRGFIGEYEDTIMFRPNNFELYFEEKKFDEFVEKLKASEVKLLHPVKEYPWGQHVVRFFDPDQHIIEVGESMVSVVKRFAEEGLTVDEIAEKTQHPVDFVEKALKEKIQKKLVAVKC